VSNCFNSKIKNALNGFFFFIYSSFTRWDWHPCL
jgi:hypothetical protein